MNTPQADLAILFAEFAFALIVMALINDAIQHRGFLWRWYERHIKKPMARRAAWMEIKKSRGNRLV